MTDSALPAALVLLFALILGGATQAMDWLPANPSGEPLLVLQHPY